MAVLADHYPHLEPSDCSPNQLATRVTLPFWEGRSGVNQIGLRGGFRNFVRRGHGETMSWHGMPFWRTVTVSFGCHTTHIVNIEVTAIEGSNNALCYLSVLARPCAIEAAIPRVAFYLAGARRTDPRLLRQRLRRKER